MDGDSRFYLWLTGMLLTATVVATLGGCALQTRHIEKMAELGYEEHTMPGTQYLAWRKTEK